jgi:cell division septum initiation protein DivIVA
MSGNMDDLKKAVDEASENQEKFATKLLNMAEEIRKHASSLEFSLGKHKTRNRVVSAMTDASKAVEKAAESCRASAKATQEYAEQRFGGQ